MATGTAHTAGVKPFFLPVCFPAVGANGGTLAGVLGPPKEKYTQQQQQHH